MFGKKKKSVPERILATVGEALDGHVTGIAKNLGTFLATLAVVAVGGSAVVNAVRENDDE